MLSFCLSILALSGSTITWGFETSQTYISSIVLDDEGVMWCTTSGGIIRYHPEDGWLEPLLYPDDLPWPGVGGICFQDTLLWVATTGAGLVLVEGDTWKVFTSYEGIPGSGTVHAVCKAGGYIWAGTDGGLARGGEDGFVVIDAGITGGAFTAEEVTDIFGTGEELYFATDKGVFALDLGGSVFEPSSWTSYSEQTALLGIRGVYAVSSDSVFGFGPGGVSRMTGGEWEKLLDYSMSGDSVIKDLLLVEDGLLAAAAVPILYDGTGWSRYGTDYPPDSHASCLYYMHGTVWCGYGLVSPNATDSGKGLGYLEEGVWRSFRIPGMGASSIYQLAWKEDRTYLGSHRAGLLAHYPDSGWTNFDHYRTDMPRTIRTYSVASTSSPGIWTSSYHWGLTWIDDRGTFSMEDDTVITFVSDSLPDVQPDVVQVLAPLLNNQVVMLAEQNDAIWVAQDAYWQTPDEPSGLVAVRGDPEGGDLQWAVRTETDGLAAKNVRRVFPCGQDSLWISFASEGGAQLLVHGGDPLDTGSDTWYPAPGQAFSTSWGLPSNQVFCFSRDQNGEILLGTGNGTARWTGTSFVDTGGITGAVKAMEVDGRGVIWCMTEGAVYSIDGQDVTQYTSANSIYIPSNRAENEFSAYDPATGTVYFSSRLGLWTITCGPDSPESPDPLFYPQPYIPAEGPLRLAWSGEGGPVSVKFFSLAGEYLGSVEAGEWENWSWDGTLYGSRFASGIYMVLLETPGNLRTGRMVLVR